MTNLKEVFDLSQSSYEQLCHGRAWPLPTKSSLSNQQDKYEVVVSGAGPAGLFLTLLLARYGLPDSSLLCVDGKERATDIGHADGISARTLEILATLNLETEVIKKGRPLTSGRRWQLTEEGLKSAQNMEFEWCPSRFGHVKTYHQGMIERILLRDLGEYSKKNVQYSNIVTDVCIDESDKTYPVLVTIQSGDETRKVRTKYLVGADGGHSKVRRSMGLSLEGESIDRIFGVTEFVPESDFPHIHRVNMMFDENHNQLGLIIPREQLSNGDYLVRFYCEMIALDRVNDHSNRERIQQIKDKITSEQVFEQVQKCVKPYNIQTKEGTGLYWWATYSVGQRLANRFHVEDGQGHPRVFLVGDACHNHSPLQGQGMNISTQDSYNLSWKLAYAVLGLTPNPIELLRSYELERRPVAERVVFFDKRWNQSNIPFKDRYQEMRSQVTACGVEYSSNLIVSDVNRGVDLEGRDLLSGVLKVGRRLLNTKVMRYVDDTVIDMHDDTPSNGKYRMLVLTSDDFPNGRSREAVQAVCDLAMEAPDLLEAIVLQPHMEPTFEWQEIPAVVKKHAEMRLHCASKDVYETYGVNADLGAIALIRPDGMVAMTTELEEVALMKDFLKQVLQWPSQTNGISHEKP